ncbi:hypothetical protein BC937DRAFT_87475 [Endogone sp. FLAS-F59071]|nr:hypothetical protein BC937DRAFT_87475 [Endogone sp. FLAS-F59071]|eukprot:RUS12583.1 hypothetical protein BC937DRAFT_87475 [Endogone sp. FLAS-F59071]
MLPILLNHPSDPSNSETSERLLHVLAASPIATSILEDALNNDSMSDGNSWSIRIPYEGLRSEFRLSDLVCYSVVYTVCLIIDSREWQGCYVAPRGSQHHRSCLWNLSPSVQTLELSIFLGKELSLSIL